MSPDKRNMFMAAAMGAAGCPVGSNGWELGTDLTARESGCSVYVAVSYFNDYERTKEEDGRF